MKLKEEEYDTMKAAYEEKNGKMGENDDELTANQENLESAERSIA